MGAQAKMQSDAFEQLKRTLEDAPRDYAFLAEYVRELELHRKEEDVFLRLAFRNASVGGAHHRTGTFVVIVVSELYEPLDADHRLEVKRWWHEKVRREANQFDDLRTRLSRVH